jgi:solute:Na+ symporter, SSS family
MRHLKKITAFILILFLSIWKGEVAAESSINKVVQQSYPLFEKVDKIPGNEGLAGVFAGIHYNMLLVAGGTVFPEGKPWEGGTKYFSDAVLVYERTANGVQLQNAAAKLPVALGEGASVSLPQGLLCIGGQTPDGLSNRVFLLELERLFS